jgi:hypothetical protein
MQTLQGEEEGEDSPLGPVSAWADALTRQPVEAGDMVSMMTRHLHAPISPSTSSVVEEDMGPVSMSLHAMHDMAPPASSGQLLVDSSAQLLLGGQQQLSSLGSRGKLPAMRAGSGSGAGGSVGIAAGSSAPSEQPDLDSVHSVSSMASSLGGGGSLSQQQQQQAPDAALGTAAGSLSRGGSAGAASRQQSAGLSRTGSVLDALFQPEGSARASRR